MGTAAKSTAEIRALTGIRGVAALLVAIYHFFLPQLAAGSVSYKLLGRGYLYVDLFFILSGYVIALNYGASFSQGVRLEAVWSFLWRRAARIYPAYLAVLAIMLTAHWLVHHDFELHPGWWIGVHMPHPWRDFPINAALVQSWGFGAGVVGQAWSVSTEVAAYLVFPWLAWCVLGKRNDPTVLALALMSVPALLVAAQLLGRRDGLYHAGAFDIWDGPPAVMRCLGGFTLGICLQRLAASHFGRMAQSDAFGGCAIGLALLMLLSSAPDLLLYVPFAALVLCLANNDGRLGAVIGSPPFYTMGLLSYSFYLIHVYFIPPMRAFTGALTPVMPGLIAEVISIGVFVPALLACSWFLYSAVEQPGRNLLRHIGESVARRGAARTVA